MPRDAVPPQDRPSRPPLADRARLVARRAKSLTPEDMLQRAMHARTARTRATWAQKGLSARGRLDRTTQAMLLRQLYLSHYESRRFAEARDIARQTVELDVLTDVIHQDAARACVGLGEVDEATGHLRLAARVGPPKRRAFHWWTLGSVLHVARRFDEALGALSRAARWGTTDKALYQGHLAVVRCAMGREVEDLTTLMERLEEVPAGQGYGRFVLGHLAFHAQRWEEARRYLELFVQRTTHGRPAMSIALEGELRMARETLQLMRERRLPPANEA